MTIFFNPVDYVNARFTCNFPKNSVAYRHGIQSQQISRKFKILSSAFGIGVAAFAFSRCNIIASAAMGTITFHAAAEIGKKLTIADVEKRCLQAADSSKSTSSASTTASNVSKPKWKWPRTLNKEDEQTDKRGTVIKFDSTENVAVEREELDEAQPTQEEKWTDPRVKTEFIKYLRAQEQSIDLPRLQFFLANPIGDLFKDELNDIQANLQGQEATEALFKEMHSAYKELTMLKIGEDNIRLDTEDGISPISGFSLKYLTVQQLRVLVFMQEKCRPASQELVYDEHVLEDGKKLAEYGISSGAYIVFSIKKDDMR
jgi:hypothetical protein